MKEYFSVDFWEFECLHVSNSELFFSPTIKEVLSQIPRNIAKSVDAFEIIEYPKSPEDFHKNPIISANGFYTSKVRLYRKKRWTLKYNPSIKNEGLYFSYKQFWNRYLLYT